MRASKCTNKGTKPDWVHASLELCKRKNEGKCVFRCTERSSVHQRNHWHYHHSTQTGLRSTRNGKKGPKQRFIHCLGLICIFSFKFPICLLTDSFFLLGLCVHHHHHRPMTVTTTEDNDTMITGLRPTRFVFFK